MSARFGRLNRGDDLKVLHPPSEARSFYLPVSGGHELYVEESGNPQGKPVLYLHGGPGGGTNPDQRRYFNPTDYRVINFAQRGSPPSRFEHALRENETPKVLEDIEFVRQKLRVDKWMLFGKSWGSTLALLYAERHPELVTQMVLQGIFLARPSDYAFYYHFDAARSWPERDALLGLVPGVQKEGLDAALAAILVSDDSSRRRQAARAWTAYGASLFGPEIESVEIGESVDETAAALEATYAKQRGFMNSPDEILGNVHRISQIPAILVHGAKDHLTPIEGARALTRAWPRARLIEIAVGGHSSKDSVTTDALVSAVDEFARQ